MSGRYRVNCVRRMQRPYWVFRSGRSGAGGIGFDVAEFLLHKEPEEMGIEEFMAYWGVDMDIDRPGGLDADTNIPAPDRDVFLLQRKASKHGSTLGALQKTIALANDSCEVMRLFGIVVQRRADFSNAKPQTTVTNDAAGPDLLQQLFLADKLTWALRQVAQHPQAPRAKLDWIRAALEAIGRVLQ